MSFGGGDPPTPKQSERIIQGAEAQKPPDGKRQSNSAGAPQKPDGKRQSNSAGRKRRRRTAEETKERDQDDNTNQPNKDEKKKRRYCNLGRKYWLDDQRRFWYEKHAKLSAEMQLVLDSTRKKTKRLNKLFEFIKRFTGSETCVLYETRAGGKQDAVIGWNPGKKEPTMDFPNVSILWDDDKKMKRPRSRVPIEELALIYVNRTIATALREAFAKVVIVSDQSEQAPVPVTMDWILDSEIRTMFFTKIMRFDYIMQRTTQDPHAFNYTNDQLARLEEDATISLSYFMQ